MTSEQVVTGAELEAAGIIPDVLPVRYTSGSFALFPVTFAESGVAAERGNVLLPSAAQQPQYSLPPAIASSDGASALYTVLMYDPDGPSRRNPRFRNIIHLLHANIPAAALTASVHSATAAAGTVQLPYRPPGPPQGGGRHRYVWLLYRHSAPIDCSRLPSFGGMSGAGKQKPDEMEERLAALQGRAGRSGAGGRQLARSGVGAVGHTEDATGVRLDCRANNVVAQDLCCVSRATDSIAKRTTERSNQCA